MISKPMLASNCGDVKELDFKQNKYLVTPKIDGIRALKINGKLVSRTFKPIRNKYIKGILEELLPDNADGEILCPGAFQNTTSGVMSEEGEPEFVFYWFDLVKDDLSKPYQDRVTDMQHAHCIRADKEYIDKIELLVPLSVTDARDIEDFESKCLKDGHEGVIIRKEDSPYKCGRATKKEQWLLKLKQFSDGEATIIGFVEKKHNANVATKDMFGRTHRSSHKGNLIPMNTLGCLKVKDVVTGIDFEIGTGFNDELRKKIWRNKREWYGLMIKYKHFEISGVKDKPRHPVYLGVRDEEDM